jgi:hypothetical protein
VDRLPLPGAELLDAAADLGTQRRPEPGLYRPRLAVGHCLLDLAAGRAEDRDRDQLGAEDREPEAERCGECHRDDENRPEPRPHGAIVPGMAPCRG